MKHDVLIKADRLQKTFRIGFWRKKVRAVREVSFEVQRGEIFGLVGPNGAGKTTTMKMLTGLISADQGKVHMFGHPVEQLETRAKLGYLPENPYFYEHLTPVELLEFYGRLHGLSRPTIRRRSEVLLEQVGLAFARDRQLRKFSKGMRQRAGIAQALINDPELVILDEPQSGLDPVGRKEVRDLIVRLKAEGKTVFFSSHILPDIEAVCDRVALMSQGCIRAIGPLSELTGGHVATIEIRAENLSVEDAAAVAPDSLQVEARGTLTVIEVPSDTDLDAVLAGIAARGGQVYTIARHEQNLEDVFMRDTNADTSRS